MRGKYFYKRKCGIVEEERREGIGGGEERNFQSLVTKQQKASLLMIIIHGPQNRLKHFLYLHKRLLYSFLMQRNNYQFCF